MTKEEASHILQGLKMLAETECCEIAIDMGISALEKNESAEEWYKLLCEKWDEGELVYSFPKGTTNGEVMNIVLRKVFPRMIFIHGTDDLHKVKSINYSEEWENAPYQKGGE